MLEPLLPPAIAVREGPIEQISGRLWPQEEALCERAAPKRRREFAAGRLLAHRALAELGGPDDPILTVAGGRAPLWPAGFTGSISHTSDYAAVALARRADFAGIGVDIEEWPRFREHLESRILTATEIERELEGRSGEARQTATAVLFSAKESFYKLQHPITSAWLGFEDVEVELDWRDGAFRLVCRVAAGPFGPGRPLEGRLAVTGQRVATAVWLAASRV